LRKETCAAARRRGVDDELLKGGAVDDESVLPGLDPDILKRVVSVEVDTEHIDKMQHKAEVHAFTFYSDEPPHMAGEDNHPYPLDYFTAAIGL
jgi:hypothetical protein